MELIVREAKNGAISLLSRKECVFLLKLMSHLGRDLQYAFSGPVPQIIPREREGAPSVVKISKGKLYWSVPW